MKTNASIETVKQALHAVNVNRGYQLKFKSGPTPSGKWVNFTIKSKSGVPGARVSHSGRRLAAASWHAHGYLFEEILEREPDAVIHSGGHRIDRVSGNWSEEASGSWLAKVPLADLSILGDREDLRWMVPPDERDPIGTGADPALARIQIPTYL